MAKKKEVKPELEATEDNATENQEVEQVEKAENKEPASLMGVYVNLKDYDPSKPIEIPNGEKFIGEDVFAKSEPEREITEYDMLVMEDSGIGLAKTSLKVKVNRVSPFLREKILIDDTEKDSVMGWGEDYVLLSATNPYPRMGLKRGQIITCI